MYQTFTVHSRVDGQLLWLCFLAPVIGAAINMRNSLLLEDLSPEPSCQLGSLQLVILKCIRLLFCCP